MITRRGLLKAFLASSAAGLGVGLYAWQVEPHWLEIVERTLPIRGLPIALTGRRLVHVSDLHVGPRVSDTYILETFRRVAALRPEIVVYTGDFISYEMRGLTHAERIYRDVPRGRLGTTPTPLTSSVGTLSKVGSSPGTPTAGSASRRSCRPRWCLWRTGVTRQLRAT